MNDLKEAERKIKSLEMSMVCRCKIKLTLAFTKISFFKDYVRNLIQIGKETHKPVVPLKLLEALIEQSDPEKAKKILQFYSTNINSNLKIIIKLNFIYFII